jgi:hypothetical protein
MEIIAVNTLDDFLKLSGSWTPPHLPRDVPYIFRGQANDAWPLQPSLVRALNRTGVNEDRALELEDLAMQHFRAEAHLHIAPNTFATTTDTLSWWTLMQHHGAPTRLLDWTESVFVAAYFAVLYEPNADGAVWYLHVHSLNAAMQSLHGSNNLPQTEPQLRAAYLKSGAPPVITVCGRRNKTERMITQQGCFTVSRNVLTDHGAVLESTVTPVGRQRIFGKLLIPAKVKLAMLRQLRAMNITASALFPGLDGVARSVDELLRSAG